MYVAVNHESTDETASVPSREYLRQHCHTNTTFETDIDRSPESSTSVLEPRKMNDGAMASRIQDEYEIADILRRRLTRKRSSIHPDRIPSQSISCQNSAVSSLENVVSQKKDSPKKDRNAIAKPTSARVYDTMPLTCLSKKVKTPRAIDADKWNARYEELKRYKLEHGDCLVPTRSKDYPHLGNWVSTQRAELKKRQEGLVASSLTDERIIALNVVGFVWNVDVPWELRLEELMLYRHQHGNYSVPRTYKKNPALGRWVHAQRTAYKNFISGKKSKITPNRVMILESIGFKWSQGQP
uniref:Helicase-associated domain-containing protein n=1 Tax=Leptocylindrus danicus TaxID=163516 RepID=A0A7S2K661_9STRA|mmetsp:Transcript_17621/g.26230  ORF Transcript_17621/g.26230 Transcript_17621/m.26230 type:complete len:297 (+) Transcript_17621:46-936(+)